MVTLKQFLAKAMSPALDKVVKRLTVDCSKFIDDLTAPIYHGTMSSITNIKQMKVSRRKVEGANILPSMIDDIAEERLGYNPILDSVLASGRFSQADAHGVGYLIFMIGDFDATIIPGGNDLEIDIRKYAAAALKRPALADDYSESALGLAGAQPVARYIADKIKEVDLASAVKNNGEIMLHGSGYYLVNIDWIKENFEMSPEQFIKALK